MGAATAKSTLLPTDSACCIGGNPCRTPSKTARRQDSVNDTDVKADVSDTIVPALTKEPHKLFKEKLCKSNTLSSAAMDALAMVKHPIIAEAGMERKTSVPDSDTKIQTESHEIVQPDSDVIIRKEERKDSNFSVYSFASSRISSACSSDRSESDGDSDSSIQRKPKKHKRKRLFLTHTMGMMPSEALQIIIENEGDIHAFYKLSEKELGKGAFGVVRTAKLKATGAVRVSKEVCKEKRPTSRHLIRQEIEIMKVLDHPNLLMLYEIFEDAEKIYLVLELCEGGELMSYVVKHGYFSEVQCASAMQQIVRAMLYLHNHYIIHRDIKSENVLVSRKGPIEHNRLKIADFGLACFLKPKKVLEKSAGTLSHMAPEVISHRYWHACDLWSCGVMMYILLCGEKPFIAPTEDDLRQKIINARVEFSSARWIDISNGPIQLVEKLLNKKPKERLTSIGFLTDPWLVRTAPPADMTNLKPGCIDDLLKFRSRNKLKRAALHVMASMLSDADTEDVRNAFIAVDANGDGMFSVDELRQVLEVSQGKKLEDVVRGKRKSLIEMHDFTYTEFLAATFDRKEAMRKGLGKAAFQAFDKNGDGSVSISELATGKLMGKMELDEIADALEEIDDDEDQNMGYNEFLKMMKTKQLD